MKPRQLRVWSAGLGLLLLAGIMVAEVGHDVLSAESLNATSALALPAWLDDLTRRSAVAYPSHAALGTALETLHLSPAASAVQWLKAAAHPRTDTELDRSARGISAAVARDPGGRAFHTVCKFREIGNASQIRAVDQAGIPCHLWTPEVALQANVSPGQVRPGATIEFTALVTSRTDVVGLVDVEIHDADEEKVTQWVFPNERLDAGRQQTYAITWQIPESLPPGTYEVKLGVFAPGWTALHGWKRFAATIDVGP
jgi:hypothetical protein